MCNWEFWRKQLVGNAFAADKVVINTFDTPNTVVPKSLSAKAEDGKLILNLQPKWVTVVSAE